MQNYSVCYFFVRLGKFTAFKMLRFFLLATGLSSALSPSRCYSHEEVRMGGVWLVDCHGHNARGPLGAYELGEFRYRSGDHTWSSADPRMYAFSISLPPTTVCDEESIDRWARCVEVPGLFARCLGREQARLVGDSTFPLYATSPSDMRDAIEICAPTNSTIIQTRPLTAFNKHDVLQGREERERAQNVVLAVLMALAMCYACNCCERAGRCCDACHRGCSRASRDKYGKVTQGRA